MRFSIITTAAAGALCAWAIALVPAVAGFQSYGGGLTVRSEQWPNRTLKTEFDDPSKLKAILDNAWSQQSDSVCDEIKADMSKADSIAKGVNAYDISCHFGAAGDLSIDVSQLGQNTFGLLYVVHGNGIDFHTTTNSVLGGWADPSWSLGFDVDVAVNLAISQPKMTLSVNSATASIAHPNFDSHNISADLALTFKPSIRDDVNASLGKKQVDLKSRINDQIKLVSALALEPFGKAGYRIVTSTFPTDRLVLTFGGKQYVVPTSGAGTVSGTIRWKKSSTDATVVNPCGSFLVQATTVNGYQNAGDFVAPSTKVGNDAYGHGDLVGDTFECAYTVTNLPVGPLLQITAKAQTSPNGYYASFAPAFIKLALKGGVAAGSSMNIIQSQSVSSSTVSQAVLSPAQIAYGVNSATNADFALSWMGVPR